MGVSPGTFHHLLVGRVQSPLTHLPFPSGSSPALRAVSRSWAAEPGEWRWSERWPFLLTSVEISAGANPLEPRQKPLSGSATSCIIQSSIFSPNRPRSERGWDCPPAGPRCQFLAQVSECTSPSSFCLGPQKAHHGFPTCCFLETPKYGQSDMEQQGLALPSWMKAAGAYRGKSRALAQHSPPLPAPRHAQLPAPPRTLAASSPAGEAASSLQSHTGSTAVFIALSASVLHKLGEKPTLSQKQPPCTQGCTGSWHRGDVLSTLLDPQVLGRRL